MEERKKLLSLTIFLTQKNAKNILNFSLGVRVTSNPNSLTALVKSLKKPQGMVVIDLSCIPVNKCLILASNWLSETISVTGVACRK